MIARAQDGDRLFMASTGLRYLARNWKFESISLQRRVYKLSAPGRVGQPTTGRATLWRQGGRMGEKVDG